MSSVLVFGLLPVREGVSPSFQVDGDLDLLNAGRDSENVVWYENKMARVSRPHLPKKLVSN